MEIYVFVSNSEIKAEKEQSELNYQLSHLYGGGVRHMQECWNLEKTWENIFEEVFGKLVQILCIPTFFPPIIAEN